MEDVSELVQRTLRGDLAAFELLVQRHHFAIRSFFAARLNDPYSAEDLAQETFLAAFRNLKKYEQGRPFMAWLRGIATHRLRNFQRKAQLATCGSTQEIDALMIEAIETVNEGGWVDSAADALKHCLGRLDDKARGLLQRRYVDESSIAQLCEEMGFKHSHLTMLLHRLRLQLKSCVERRMADSGGRAGV
jgi:RNA polymerase sigma-70 factor, ECF subfamily